MRVKLLGLTAYAKSRELCDGSAPATRYPYIEGHGGLLGKM